MQVFNIIIYRLLTTCKEEDKGKVEKFLVFTLREIKDTLMLIIGRRNAYAIR
jgi:hypothetical protein